MLRRVLLTMVIVIMTMGFVSSPVTVAQEGDSVDLLVISHFDDLWVTNEVGFADPTLFTPCGLTNSGEQMQSRLVMSPNGDHIAYATLPTAFTDLLQSGGGFNGAAPSNIRLCDGNLLQELLVSGQPDDLSLEGGILVSHSIPTWSPDSTKLAWTRINGFGDELLLQVYDVATNTITTLPASIPPQYGIPQPLRLEWGEPGILVESYTLNTETTEPIEELVLYDTAGTLLQRIPATVEDVFLNDFFWATGIDGSPLIIGDFSDPFIRQYNFSTGEWAFLEGVLEYYAPDAPEGSFVLTYSPNETFTALWEVKLGEDSRWLLDYRGHRLSGSIAIAPSGQTVAYVTDQVYLWQSEDQISAVGLITDGQVDPQTSLVWSPMRWRIVAGGYGG